MNINIKATKTTLTPAIKQFVEKKIKSALGRFLLPEDKIHVELEVASKHHSGQIYRTEIDVQPHRYYAESWAEDFYAAIDLVLPKIKEQILKQKEKRLARRRRLRKD